MTKDQLQKILNYLTENDIIDIDEDFRVTDEFCVIVETKDEEYFLGSGLDYLSIFPVDEMVQLEIFEAYKGTFWHKPVPWRDTVFLPGSEIIKITVMKDIEM